MKNHKIKLIDPLKYAGTVDVPKNVLADRYASPEMVAVFSEKGKIALERQLWVAVMEAQNDLGYPIAESIINDYKKVIDKINLESIKSREKILRHDVKARIEEFNSLARHEKIHLGMTSRDLTENIEQLQIKTGLEIIHKKIISTLVRMATRAKEYSNIVMAGRSHNVPAQVTLLGKRFASSGQEILNAERHISQLLENYALRGIKGPVGTQQDMLNLFKGNLKVLQEFEKRIAATLGFNKVLNSVGQIYPRSMDLEIINSLQLVSAGPASLATTFRLMTGQELLTEGFKKGQVGSSAMPHKMNARTSERICGFKKILDGYAVMIAGISGDQWNEGDVSDSVIRRVVIPDSFYAIDGMLENLMTALDEMGIYPAIIDQELQRYMPYLMTSTILVEALKNGGDREQIHSAIKQHAVAVALEMREKAKRENDLFERLAKDERIPINLKQIKVISKNVSDLVGSAPEQINNFVSEVRHLANKYPETASYQPINIL
jgi:adenylosuccinate lyase